MSAEVVTTATAMKEKRESTITVQTEHYPVSPSFFLPHPHSSYLISNTDTPENPHEEVKALREDMRVCHQRTMRLENKLQSMTDEMTDLMAELSLAEAEKNALKKDLQKLKNLHAEENMRNLKLEMRNKAVSTYVQTIKEDLDFYRTAYNRQISNDKGRFKTPVATSTILRSEDLLTNTPAVPVSVPTSASDPTNTSYSRRSGADSSSRHARSRRGGADSSTPSMVSTTDSAAASASFLSALQRDSFSATASRRRLEWFIPTAKRSQEQRGSEYKVIALT